MPNTDEIEMVDGLVRALAKGFCGSDVREPGEVFQYKGPLGSWMEKVDSGVAAKAPVEKSAAPQAQALSAAALEELKGKPSK
jgi:hypothetical protein